MAKQHNHCFIDIKTQKTNAGIFWKSFKSNISTGGVSLDPASWIMESILSEYLGELFSMKNWHQEAALKEEEMFVIV